MSSESVQTLLEKLNKAPKANNIYIALEDSSSLNKDQYSLAKVFVIQFLRLIFSLKASFFKTSMIQYDESPTRVIQNQVSLEPIEAAVHQLKHNGEQGSVNILGALDEIQTLANDQPEGKKALFLFTTGEAMDSEKILELIANGFEIVCFLMLQDDEAKKTELEAIFGNQRVIPLPNLKAAQDYFGGLVVGNIGVPKISEKKVGYSSATLNITGIEDCESVKVFVKRSRLDTPGEDIFKNCKEITLHLQPEARKYIVSLQGIKGSRLSEVSNELVINLQKVHPITLRIQDSRISQELRTHILEFKVPQPLQDAGIETYNIGLVGDMGNGKSSFINLLLTAVQDTLMNRICGNAPIGTGESTLTLDINRYSITQALKIFDRYGTQFGDDLSELGNFMKGRLLHGFRQGGAQNEENDRFRSEASPKSAPHLIIYIVDIRSAENDDSIKKFGEIYSFLKQKHGVQVLVCLTKLDKLQDKETSDFALDESDLGEALENETVQKFMKNFALKAEISEKEIFPIFNYTGPFEERSEIKDAFALVLLDKVIQGISTYFQKYTVVQIIDQTKQNHSSLLLEDLEVSLDTFLKKYSRKISNQQFKPTGFLTNKEDRIVPEEKWPTTYLTDIKFNHGMQDGYQVCTLKLHNGKVDLDQSTMTTVTDY